MKGDKVPHEMVVQVEKVFEEMLAEVGGASLGIGEDSIKVQFLKSKPFYVITDSVPYSSPCLPPSMQTNRLVQDLGHDISMKEAFEQVVLRRPELRSAEVAVFG